MAYYSSAIRLSVVCLQKLYNAHLNASIGAQSLHTASFAVSDLIIGGLMSWGLWRLKTTGRTMVGERFAFEEQSNKLVNKLIAVVLETNALTCAVAVMTVIVQQAQPKWNYYSKCI